MDLVTIQTLDVAVRIAPVVAAAFFFFGGLWAWVEMR